MSEQEQHLINHVNQLCDQARPAAQAIAIAANALRQAALESAAIAIEAASDSILIANAKDMAQAAEMQLSSALRDRLLLDQDRLTAIVSDLRSVIAQEDPVGRSLEQRDIHDDIHLEKIAVPIGVVAIIFESRPNVTVDAAALCLRSGNACILRGGKEAVHSNNAFITAIRSGLEKAGVNPNCVQLVQEQDRALIPLLLARDESIDIVIPRGGEALIKAVVACSKVPVIKHDKGVCSVYVHQDADIEMASQIILNAKCQRPGVCNAIENILIDHSIAATALPIIASALSNAGVEIRGDSEAQKHSSDIIAANDSDWQEEYLDLIVAIKCVHNIEEAISFTNTNGSHHSDSIITANSAAAESYLRCVDSACVYHNASTRYTDGSQFGLGAEVGISTNRLHARGPMGINELCTYKFVLRGNGQVRK